MPDDPGMGHWEAKATHARETADRMVNPAAVRIMLELANYYDVLASEARDFPSSRLGNEILYPDSRKIRESPC
jgi:hypothetical protein